MVSITLPDELVYRLEAISRQENRPLADVVAAMAEKYQPEPTSPEQADAAFDALFGIYDDDVTNMSTSVRETLEKYYKEKYGSPD